MTTALDNNATLDSLLEKLWQDKGWDFRDYKRGTLARRTARRLLATGSRTYRDYMRVLDSQPEEYQRLRDYLTVTVSSFFRSPHTFRRFALTVLPEVLARKVATGQHDIRVWSAGCAGGEEPYSMAIMLRDFLLENGPDWRVSIFATDISQRALRKAAAGLYPPDGVTGLPAAVLEKHFTHGRQGHAVRSEVRELVSFSYFDLTSAESPPFASLDAVFCCNVLIYLQRPCQARVVDKLYRSLAAPGYLVLGEAETPPGELGHKLECLDSRARIYRKR